LQEKPRDDEHLELVWMAAKEHLQTTAELLARVDEILEKKSIWEKNERSAIVSKRFHALVNWRAGRNSL
jgi:hypothetical protein